MHKSILEKLINKSKIPTAVQFKLLNSRWLLGSAGAALFWYISLFPGRIGSDPVQAINLMEKNQSTDWWSALYFWFLRLTTFNGQSIWLASLLSIIPLYLSLIYFLYSLPEKKLRVDRVAFFICISPLFGNFAVNINHDVFFTSGILLSLGYSLRIYLNSLKHFDKYLPFVAIILFLNSKTGYVLIVTLIFYFCLVRKKYLQTLILIAFSVILFLFTSIGITKSSVPMHYLPFLADIKCVAQHPEARITDSDWSYLLLIAPAEKWKKPATCSSMDIANSDIRSKSLEMLRPAEFFITYVSIASRNPAIIIQTHLQRSSMALPPPFFQGPQNMIDENINNPIGLGTNIALQQGPMVLHPSIDHPSLKIDNKYLKPLESFALLGSFLVNQASWFWGWGGLWLWPIFIYLLFKVKERRPLELIKLTYPIIVTHAVLIAIGPIPTPRYVMSTILIGNIILLFLLSELFEKTKSNVKLH
jgi:hypothetical protein